MDDTETDRDHVSTATEFEETIRELIRSAYENGVSLEGSWEVRNGKDLPDWEVLIHELAEKEGD